MRIRNVESGSDSTRRTTPPTQAVATDDHIHGAAGCALAAAATSLVAFGVAVRGLATLEVNASRAILAIPPAAITAVALGHSSNVIRRRRGLAKSTTALVALCIGYSVLVTILAFVGVVWLFAVALGDPG